MTFTAFVGLFQYFMVFLVSIKANNVRKCQIFTKAMFLEFWNKSSLKLQVCLPTSRNKSECPLTPKCPRTKIGTSQNSLFKFELSHQKTGERQIFSTKHLLEKIFSNFQKPIRMPTNTKMSPYQNWHLPKFTRQIWVVTSNNRRIANF